MYRYCLFFLLLSVSVPAFAVESKLPSRTTDDGIAWYDARHIGVEGRGFDDTETFYDRLPARAKSLVRPPVWSLSQDSAGMCVRFVTDAPAIHARWKLKKDRLAMPHMPATGVSGVDLYVRHEGRWRWLATGKPQARDNTAQLVDQIPSEQREYLLYLPLYNGVTAVEIGVPESAAMNFAPPRSDQRPIVFWGTSITHGACASRPGMCHTAILGRRFDRAVVNLGFSGNGRMEPEVAELIAEIDAAVFVIDCLPNLTADVIRQRVRPLVETIRAERPEIPILLVEDRSYANAFLLSSQRKRNDTSREALRQEYKQMQDDEITGLHYLPGDHLLGDDGDDTVDSSHPTDLGFVRQADAFEPALRLILGSPKPITRWWKGNLHTHSLWSDGNDFPEMIADWYRRHGYHFLALSDHNVLSQGMKWMKLSTIEKRGGKDALPKYIARFGDDWVETRGNSDDGSLEVRLKPLGEVRSLVEERDRFLMIPSEEITDRQAHINATNIAEVIQPQGGETVGEMIRNNLRAVDEQAKRLGRMIIPHLNHPNLGDKGISADELAALVQDEFFEVFNGVEGDGDLGSERRHSLETLWDITSTLRISQFDAPPMFALATDDSHHYHGGQKASPGRGWIRLRAGRLTPETVLAAMKQGDFYASSGVELRSIDYDPQSKTLQIEIKPDGEATFTTEFIGTPVDFDQTTTPRLDDEGNPIPGTLDYSADVGRVFETAEGFTATYQLTGDELYVRACITSSKPPLNPTSESPRQKAWTQPVGWRERLNGQAESQLACDGQSLHEKGSDPLRRGQELNEVDSPPKGQTPFRVGSKNGVRLNQIQVIGTHNSYHIAPPAAVMKQIAARGEALAESLDYTHRPLAEQFSELGIRQIELDVFADPDGGKYAEPMAARNTDGVEPPNDPQGLLRKPGLKVLHVQDFDYRTTVLTFVEALQQIRQWLQQNPQSVPIMVLVEAKDTSLGPLFTVPQRFGAAELDTIDQEILSVFEPEEIIKPDDVRGEFEALRDAVIEQGWPLLDEVRGKVIFALDNGGRIRDAYLQDHPSLENRLLFVSIDADHPAAAFMKLNDPVGGFEKIRKAVEQGFIVRTRADSGTKQSRRNDISQREKALASGAQFVSTDYPEPDERFSDYVVRLPGGVVARLNPVSGAEIEAQELDETEFKNGEVTPRIQGDHE